MIKADILQQLIEANTTLKTIIDFMSDGNYNNYEEEEINNLIHNTTEPLTEILKQIRR